MNTVINLFLLRNWRSKWIGKKWIESIESELAEGFLDLLLRFMQLVFWVDRDFKKNIKNFNGRYLFKSRDSRITVAAVFRKDNFKIYRKSIDNTNITITFRNAKALMNYLLAPKPDILGSILRQDVTIDGNLNYLYKFAYMAKRLQLMATGKI